MYPVWLPLYCIPLAAAAAEQVRNKIRGVNLQGLASPVFGGQVAQTLLCTWVFHNPTIVLPWLLRYHIAFCSGPYD